MTPAECTCMGIGYAHAPHRQMGQERRVSSHGVKRVARVSLWVPRAQLIRPRNPSRFLDMCLPRYSLCLSLPLSLSLTQAGPLTIFRDRADRYKPTGGRLPRISRPPSPPTPANPSLSSYNLFCAAVSAFSHLFTPRSRAIANFARNVDRQVSECFVAAFVAVFVPPWRRYFVAYVPSQ
jgi:hypothetical protein